MGKILVPIIGILVLAIILLRSLPFIPLETKIEWITIIGLILMFVTGGAAFAIVKNALIAVVFGAVTFAIILAVLKTLPELLSG